jgi:ankyrin repeat protein
MKLIKKLILTVLVTSSVASQSKTMHSFDLIPGDILFLTLEQSVQNMANEIRKHDGIKQKLQAIQSELNLIKNFILTSRRCSLVRRNNKFATIKQSIIDTIQEADINLDATLIYIAQKNSVYSNLIPIIVAAGADINAVGVNGYRPLHYAVNLTNSTGSKMAVIQALIHTPGINLNSQADGKTTPLLYAIDKNCFEAVMVLIGAGAEINAQDCLGDTPLHYAVSKKSLDIVNALILAGADKTIQNSRNQTPHDLAVLENASQEILNLLKN